jgi:5-methylcytosine-specific restriction endonuclease McrA
MALKRTKPLKAGKPLKRTPLNQGETPLKRTGKPKARSAKTDKVYQERRPLVARLLAERPGCEACPIFAAHDGKVTYRRNASCDIHELCRRSQGGSILDEANLLAVCRECHTRIGDYPQLAFDLGLAKHGWERDR